MANKKFIKSFICISLTACMCLSGLAGCGRNNKDNGPVSELHPVESRVTVHDPSIVYDEANETYYIYGSHRAWASSKDLINWEYVENNINTDYATIFKTNGEWSSRGSSNYNISGNCWAPAMFYNKDMQKWCLYMSINGDNYYSSIALATADSIDGPFTYAGTVIYSGFTNAEEAAMTDYAKVSGTNEVRSDFLTGRGTWNPIYGTNCIDPCVFYDENGELWMSYGSWFGGLFLIKLDKTTGLRDYTYTYATERNVSDEYLGIKISGGFKCTGEGSFIVWDESTGYYYLYVSYGGLNATDSFSGYNIRLFRSENITGPYVDAMGNTGICDIPQTNQSEKGIKLFGNYYFSSLADADKSSNAYKGYMSGGHNSAIIAPDGNYYLIYHTRFNLGKEWHQVRVHQQFLNEDGWLVTAPYEYLGSVISKSGYDKSELVGTYEFIDHGLTYSAKYTDMLDTLTVTLNKDGSVTGDVTGTWEQKKGEDGIGYYATFIIDEVTYKGVFFKQYDESAGHNEVMTFSVIGSNDKSLWGSKIVSEENSSN